MPKNSTLFTFWCFFTYNYKLFCTLSRLKSCAYIVRLVKYSLLASSDVHFILLNFREIAPLCTFSHIRDPFIVGHFRAFCIKIIIAFFICLLYNQSTKTFNFLSFLVKFKINFTFLRKAFTASLHFYI